jgi:hypothetical protein
VQRFCTFLWFVFQQLARVKVQKRRNAFHRIFGKNILGGRQKKTVCALQTVSIKKLFIHQKNYQK